jgi:hypothetical protein
MWTRTTTPPVGDATLAEGRERLGATITIMAGLEYLYLNGYSEPEMEEKIADIKSEVTPGNGTIFNFSAYPNVTVNTIKKVISKYRRCFDGIKITSG